jgi:c-di-GMP-related signal transduction protein
LHIGADDALAALQSRQAGAASPEGRSPVRPGNLYEGVCSHALAQHCLDEADAWGLLGWPEEDVLFAWRHRAMACDASVLVQIREAVASDRSLDRIERLIRQDPVIAYRLLLLVNSAGHGAQREVETLRHAIMMLGFSAFSQWLAGLQASADTDPALHPVRYAQVMRSRLAQHLLDSGSGETLRAEVYLAAVLSQIDRLLMAPLGALLEKLPLPLRTTDALLRQQGPYHPLLELASALGQPDQLHHLPALCDTHGFSLEHINRALLRMITTSRDEGGVMAAPPPP